MKPFIGITTRLNDRGEFYLDRKYGEAVEWAGGTPIYIPLITDRSYLEDMFNRLDGLVLSGSQSDVDPALYGEQVIFQCGPIVPERDATDLFLLELAENKKMPVLAICFGMQSLNVSRGGTLYQDIPTQTSATLDHRDFKLRHDILIEKGSLLEKLAGSDKAIVNSTHHQSVKKAGRDLQVIASSEDGIIEAMIDTRPDRFVLAVQWHPERLYENDEFARAIFKTFIEQF